MLSKLKPEVVVPVKRKTEPNIPRFVGASIVISVGLYVVYVLSIVF